MLGDDGNDTVLGAEGVELPDERSLRVINVASSTCSLPGVSSVVSRDIVDRTDRLAASSGLD